MEPQINSTNIVAYQVSKIPKMLLIVHDNIGESKLQQLIIKVYNKKDDLKHSVILGISNSP